MVEERWIFNTLLTFLKSVIPSLPDIRSGNNKKYKMKDAVLSAFAPLFVQCPSFLSYQRLMEQNKGKNNGRSIFNIDAIPSDNHIRNMLDPIAPSYFYPVFNDAFHFLEDTKTLDTYHSAFDTYLIALDATWFHSSEKIYCDHCLHKDHKDGRKTYYHSVITPVIVRPGSNKVISLEPEFIQNRDGNEKQDCEKENLSNLLLTLNLLAFLFHTILEFLDKRYALIRKKLPRRTTFYDDLRALTRYFYFRHWKHLMLFMLEGLELEDPGG